MKQKCAPLKMYLWHPNLKACLRACIRLDDNDEICFVLKPACWQHLN